MFNNLGILYQKTISPLKRFAERRALSPAMIPGSGGGFGGGFGGVFNVSLNTQGSQGATGATGPMVEFSKIAGIKGETGATGPMGSLMFGSVTTVKSSIYTATENDYYIGVNNADPVLITLPLGTPGRIYIIKDEYGAGSGTIAVQGSEGELIDNTLFYNTATPLASTGYIFSGTQWHVIMRSTV